ncbi:MAG TPA: hypothetical protein VGL72_16365 [Bryobacteraceae bacterium]
MHRIRCSHAVRANQNIGRRVPLHHLLAQASARKSVARLLSDEAVFGATPMPKVGYMVD